VTAQDLKRQRRNAGISGAVLCTRAGVDRARLSNIENEHISPLPDEIERLEAALSQLMEAKQKVIRYAETCDLPLSAL
jgi:transcriptional regulator with XRE-family HTH domain